MPRASSSHQALWFVTSCPRHHIGGNSSNTCNSDRRFCSPCSLRAKVAVAAVVMAAAAVAGMVTAIVMQYRALANAGAATARHAAPTVEPRHDLHLLPELIPAHVLQRLVLLKFGPVFDHTHGRDLASSWVRSWNSPCKVSGAFMTRDGRAGGGPPHERPFAPLSNCPS